MGLHRLHLRAALTGSNEVVEEGVGVQQLVTLSRKWRNVAEPPNDVGALSDGREVLVWK